MTFHLPEALSDSADTRAEELLRSYYGSPFGGPRSYGGANFDAWDSVGTRAADADRFTADDLVAVTFLSVQVPAPVARSLLRDKAGQFTDLLREVGDDRDLVEEAEPLLDTWPGWALMNALREYADVGTTIASKLYARKRPRLRPIWDSVVAEVTGGQTSLWEPLRMALRDQDGALHERLLRLRHNTGLPPEISVLRVFDVICWREGKDARETAARSAQTARF